MVNKVKRSSIILMSIMFLLLVLIVPTTKAQVSTNNTNTTTIIPPTTTTKAQVSTNNTNTTTIIPPTTTTPTNTSTQITTQTSTSKKTSVKPIKVTNESTNGVVSIYSNTIHFQSGNKFVGVCYPWVIFKHNFLNLLTWTFMPGIGGDTAVSVSCGNSNFVVVGKSGVYVVSKNNGMIEEVIPFANMTYLGYSDGELGFVAPSGTVIVHTPLQGDVYIPLNLKHNEVIVNMKFSVINGLPFVVYIVSVNNTHNLMFSNPTKTITITKLPPTSRAIYIYGNYIIVADNGIEVYNIVSPNVPLVVKVNKYSMYLPFIINKFVRGNLNELYLIAQGDSIIKVDIVTKTWKFLGQGIITPIGIFVPNQNNIAMSTTYVDIKGIIYPIPGFAVARIGSLVFTNIITGGSNGKYNTVPVLWSASRSILIARKEVNGMLQVPTDNGKVKLIKLTLQPGVYSLPRNATIVTKLGAITLNKAEVYYPPIMQTEPVISSSLIQYSIMNFPKKYQVLDTFKNVKFVASGGRKLLIIEPDEAIVYAPYGVVSVIPGVWKWGGISNYVVLYDGTTFRVFDLAGNPLVAYSAYITTPPIYTAVTHNSNGYSVHLFFYTRYIVINSTGVYQMPNYPAPLMKDFVSGLSVTLYSNPEVSYGKFTYHIPVASFISLNMYKVVWTYKNQWYILDIPHGKVYVFLNAPDGKIFPLGNYIAYLSPSGVLQILPFSSWIVSSCYVNIFSSNSTKIFVNGKYVGSGVLKYYASCGEKLNITATKLHYKPETKLIQVEPGGVNVSFKLQPEIAYVKLNIIRPSNIPISSIIARVGTSVIVWYNNEVIKLIAGAPYRISIISYQPYNVCVPKTYNNVVFSEGNSTFTVNCELKGSVLGLKSKITTSVTIINATSKKSIVTSVLHPNITAYFAITAGKYIIESKPLVKGYTNRTISVTIPKHQVVVVDVTPYAYSRLIISAIPRTTLIKVTSATGKTVGQGTGSLTITVKPGEYQILGLAPGYQSYYGTIKVVAGETKIVNITLLPLTLTKTPSKPIWKKPKFQYITIGAVIGAVAVALWWRKKREEKEIGSENEENETISFEKPGEGGEGK